MSYTLIVRGARVLDPLAPEPRPAVRDIAIAGDRIAAVEPPGEIDPPPAAKAVDARNMLAIPGLVSAHYHSHDTLLKGCFAPMPLEAWLLHAVPPNYPQRSREEIRARVLIGALEALKSGITTLQDMASVHPFDPGEVDAADAMQFTAQVKLRGMAARFASALGTRAQSLARYRRRLTLGGRIGLLVRETLQVLFEFVIAFGDPLLVRVVHRDFLLKHK